MSIVCIDSEKELELAVVIAAELAVLDGFNPEDPQDSLFTLQWSGGSAPEPLGDAWSMDYLPKGERIAAAVFARYREGSVS